MFLKNLDYMPSGQKNKFYCSFPRDSSTTLGMTESKKSEWRYSSFFCHVEQAKRVETSRGSVAWVAALLNNMVLLSPRGGESGTRQQPSDDRGLKFYN